MKKIKNKKIYSRLKRKKHIRKRIAGTAEKPRLCVFRSINHIYAQLIDDDAQKTFASVSDLSAEVQAKCKKETTKTERSVLVGQILAKKAKENNIADVVFDRSGFRYHGRIKALADAARKAGLVF